MIPEGIGFTIAGLLITVTGLAFATGPGPPGEELERDACYPGAAYDHPHRAVPFRPPPYLFGAHPRAHRDCHRNRYFWIFCCVLLIFGLFVIKFRLEEKFLEDEFGEEYARYKRDVKALIPLLI